MPACPRAVDIGRAGKRHHRCVRRAADRASIAAADPRVRTWTQMPNACSVRSRRIEVPRARLRPTKDHRTEYERRSGIPGAERGEGSSPSLAEQQENERHDVAEKCPPTPRRAAWSARI